MKSFTCQFGAGTSCTVEIADEKPLDGSTHVLRVEWTGSPSRKTLRPYVGWMNSVNQQLADQWGVRLMHVFMVAPDKAEVWGYAPGGRPQIVTVE